MTRLPNSFDTFLHVEEIFSGDQRLHSAREIEKRLKKAIIEKESMNSCVDVFRWGMPLMLGAVLVCLQKNFSKFNKPTNALFCL